VVRATVTSVLQTPSGRMIFATMPPAPAEAPAPRRQQRAANSTPRAAER